jgi:hypothetical protein
VHRLCPALNFQAITFVFYKVARYENTEHIWAVEPRDPRLSKAYSQVLRICKNGTPHCTCPPNSFVFSSFPRVKRSSSHYRKNLISSIIFSTPFPNPRFVSRSLLLAFLFNLRPAPNVAIRTNSLLSPEYMKHGQ